MKRNNLFFALVITMLISSALPYFGKELFVEKSGHIDHLDLFTVLLLMAGIRFNWKHIYEIILGIYSLYFAWIIFVVVTLAISNPVFLKLGYYLLGIDLILILIFTTILRRFEKVTVANMRL
jgi:hypothetical protein